MSKNIVLCSDGTGQAGGQGFVSNVWHVFKAVDRHKAGDEQVAFHVDGVGTEKNKYMRAIGGAFGWGLSEDIRLLYAALVRSYDADDQIYLFGFSRGAFTVRSLAGMIDDIGILDGSQFRSDDEINKAVELAYTAYRKKPGHSSRTKLEKDYKFHDGKKIKFIGVWDTVDAVGVPIDELRAVIYQIAKFWRVPHKHELNGSIENACHAISIDDERHTFHPMVWNEANFKGSGEIQQVWFAGVHSNVGGGYPKDSLAFIPLDWMLKQARQCGLHFDSAKWKSFGAEDYSGKGGEYQTQADRNGRIYDSRGGAAVYYRYKPREIADLWHKENPDDWPKIHESALMRIGSGYTGYAPTAFPATFEFVPTWKSDIESVGASTEGKEKVGQGPDLSKARYWICWRRLLYFGFLTWTLVFLLGGIILDNMSDDPCGGNGLCAGLLSVLKGVLPDFTHEWLDSYAANWGVLAVFIAILAVMGWCRRWFKSQTDSAADKAWKKIGIKRLESESSGDAGQETQS